MNKYFLGVLVIISLYIRISQIDFFAGFDFDQETAVGIATSILEGNLTLIGQEISLGGIYLSPLYNYILAVFLLFSGGNPTSIFIFHALTGLVATLLIFYVSEKIKKGSGFLSAFLYTFSYHFIYLDKTAAPSNLLVLFTLLTLSLHLSKLTSWFKLPLTGLVVSFATAVHPSAIALIVLPAITYIEILKTSSPNLKIKSTLILIFSLIAGFVPLIVFDVRHSFLISKNILSASEKLVSYPLFFRFFQRINLLSDFTRKLFFPVNTLILLQFLSLLPVVVSKINRQHKNFPLLSVAIFGVTLFTLYSGSVPEYYLLPVFTAIFILFSVALYQIFSSSVFGKIFTSFFVLFFLIANIYNLNIQKNTFSLAHKKQITSYIKNNTATPNPNIHIISDLGQNNGFKYLARWMKLDANFTEINPDFIIFVPDQSEKSNYNAGSIGVQKVVN